MSATDLFATSQGPWPAHRASDSPRNGVAVTTSDSVDLVTVSTGLYIGVSGDVAVTLVGMADGTSIVFKAHPVGYLIGQVKRVWTTNTSATNILALSQ